MLLRINEAQLFKVNDDQRQDQHVHGEDTDEVGADLKLLVFQREREVVDEDAPQNDQKAGDQLLRKLLGPGNGDEHASRIDQKTGREDDVGNDHQGVYRWKCRVEHHGYRRDNGCQTQCRRTLDLKKVVGAQQKRIGPQQCQHLAQHHVAEIDEIPVEVTEIQQEHGGIHQPGNSPETHILFFALF